MVEQQGCNGANDLSDDCCNRCTADPHGRTAEESEDHNGIKNDIQNSPDDQRNHR